MNLTCTFFGHRDAPGNIQPMLLSTIRTLIVQRSVHAFYVGNEGRFDHAAQHALESLLAEFPQIQCSIVLAKLPPPENAPLPTIFPEGFESFPPRFAISRRNQWMLHRADFVITYVRHSWGGAAKFTEQARRQKKYLIPL